MHKINVEEKEMNRPESKYNRPGSSKVAIKKIKKDNDSIILEEEQQ